MQVPDTQHLYHSYNGYRLVQRQYNRILQHYHVPIHTFLVPTPYGQTHVTVSGQPYNPPLVLVHGLANPSVMWRPNVNILARHFQVYAVDVVGDAGRSAGNRPSLLDHSYARWLVAVLDELALAHTNIIGMSLGGWITLSTMAHYPGRLRGALLVAPAGIVTLNTSLIAQALFSLPFWQTHFGIPRLLARIAEGAHDDIQQLIYLVARHHRAKSIPPVPILSEQELQRIDAPIAILIGKQDEMFNPQALLRRAQHMPGFVGGEIIPGSGHGLNATHPEQVNNHILSFFS